MISAPSRPIVVKIGGSTLGAGDTSLEDCAQLQRQGFAVVLVHGGGATVSAWLERLHEPTEFVDGLRKTTAGSRSAVVAVLAGLVNKELVQRLTRLGARVVGLSGVDAGLIRSPLSSRGLGYVGEAPTCDPSILFTLLQAGWLPVIAPIGLTPDGSELININADAAAGAIATAIQAERLVFLTDVPGILDEDGRVIAALDGAGIEALRASGTLVGGMLPKVEAGRAAAAAGAPARIVDGRKGGAVLAVLDGATGTRIETP